MDEQEGGIKNFALGHKTFGPQVEFGDFARFSSGCLAKKERKNSHLRFDIFSAGWRRWHHHMDRVGPCCSVRLKIRCFPPTLSLTVLFSSTFFHSSSFLCISSLHLMGEFNSWSRTSHPFVGKDFGRSVTFFCLFAIDLLQNSNHYKPAVLTMAK